MQEQHPQNCAQFLERLHIDWGRGGTDGGELKDGGRDRGREVKKRQEENRNRKAGWGKRGEKYKNIEQ